MVRAILGFFVLALAFTAAAVHAQAFEPCVDGASDPSLRDSLCARVPAPRSYDGAAGTIELFVRKFPTRRSRGTLCHAERARRADPVARARQK